MTWKTLEPNAEGDWLNQRNDVFDTFIPMAPEKKFDTKSESFFVTYSNGVVTSRDAWVYNFSKNEIRENITRMLNFIIHKESSYSRNVANKNPKLLENFIDNEPTMISWTRALRNDLGKNIEHSFNSEYISQGLSVRPFC
jgi:predicted helicase